MASSGPTLTCPFCDTSVSPSIAPRAGERETLRGTDTECEHCQNSFAVYYY